MGTYQRLIDDGFNPSIFTQPDPDRLLKEYAGTGTKVRGDIPGLPGYKELVNFEEFIGYAVNPHTGTKTATTYGKIHYATNGVHIVPFSSQN